MEILLCLIASLRSLWMQFRSSGDKYGVTIVSPDSRSLPYLEQLAAGIEPDVAATQKAEQVNEEGRIRNTAFYPVRAAQTDLALAQVRSDFCGSSQAAVDDGKVRVESAWRSPPRSWTKLEHGILSLDRQSLSRRGFNCFVLHRFKRRQSDRKGIVFLDPASEASVQDCHISMSGTHETPPQ